MATTFRSTDLISRTTTGISELLSFKQWSGREEAAWPNPECSLGRLIKKYGKVNCWEAMGPAREVFNEIAPDIKEYLDRSVEPISTWVTWSIYMFGKTPKTANPTIVFCCEVAAHRKEVKNIIADSGLLDGYRGLKTAHMPRAPDFQQLVPLADGQHRISSCSIEAFTSEGYANHRSGMRVFVGESASTATIGGIIQVGGKFFYTTAGHVFHLRPDDGLYYPMGNSGSAGDNDIEIDGFDTSDLESETDDEMDSDSQLEIEPAMLRVATGKLRATPDSGSEGDHGDPHLPAKVLSVGAPFLTSFDKPYQDYNLDYAIIEITHPVHHKVNEVMLLGGQGTLKIRGLVESNPNGEKVFAITSRGLLEGTISGTPVYSRHPFGTQFLETLSVSFRSPLLVGDCGAWVINAKTGALYGHIVAGDPRAGLAIVIPFRSIFEDIARQLEQVPQLPMITEEQSAATSDAQISEPLPRTPGQYMERRFKELLRQRLQSSIRSRSSRAKQCVDILPRPPSPDDQQSLEFRQTLLALRQIPLQWENPVMLDAALCLIPFDRIYADAEKEAQRCAAARGASAYYQDCIIIAMLNWFKYSFFTWVNNPRCGKCDSITMMLGMSEPTAKEFAEGVRRCELYKCLESTCREIERFPRYTNPWNLLQTKRGRNDEWVNCFGLFCRAIGVRTRFVWSAENYVWLEVYSDDQGRWVHVDPYEGEWDEPGLYTEISHMKLSYCIAFGPYSAKDVTSRYVRRRRFAKDRNKCREGVLLYILQEINAVPQNHLSEHSKLIEEEIDKREEQELRGYIVDSLIKELKQLWAEEDEFLDAALQSSGGSQSERDHGAPKTGILKVSNPLDETGILKVSKPRHETSGTTKPGTLRVGRNQAPPHLSVAPRDVKAKPTGDGNPWEVDSAETQNIH
ncbi:PNG1 with de-n-glycosylation function [Cladorrhinum sp. PSN259]|nr:PNG1 with de-n-glycosylation function [Cladorrhinum sp. PSN259]